MATWKPIPGWETHYEVSNSGQVKRIAPVKIGRGKAGRILAGCLIGGYRMVCLCRNPSEHKYMRVCRLVLMAFRRMPKDDEQANHMNGKKSDDRLSNLEWVTPQENCLHAYRVLGIKKPRGNDHHNSILTEATIALAKSLRAKGMKHREIAARIGVSRPTITAALSGRNWAHLANSVNKSSNQ